MYMIFTNLSLKYLYLFHLAQFFLNLYNIPLDLSIHYFSTIFRNKHNMVRAIPTRMLYTLIIHLWIPPCDSSNGLRNLYYYITGRFFTSRALGNASACPSPPAPLGDLYQIVINLERNTAEQWVISAVTLLLVVRSIRYRRRNSVII